MTRIFVSYRREDSPGHTGRLYDHLVAHFGENLIFRDIEAIAPGVDFVRAIEEAVESCGVLLAVIGPQWLNVQDKQGRRRLDNPRDFVRLEVATALSRNVRVIPVLVGGATFPSEEELPPDLVPLARRNAIEISDPRFRTDMAHLIRTIEAALGKEYLPEKPAPPASGVSGSGVPWRRWGAVGFVITFTVVVLAGVLWVMERSHEPEQMEGIGGAGDAGMAEETQPAPIAGAKDAGVTGKAPPRGPSSSTTAGKKRVSPPLRADAGVVQSLPDAGTDAGIDAGVVQSLPDSGTDASIAAPPPWDAGIDAGVVQSLPDSGTDASIVAPPPGDGDAGWDAGGDAGPPPPPPPPETETGSPAPSEPELLPDSGSQIPPGEQDALDGGDSRVQQEIEPME